MFRLIQKILFLNIVTKCDFFVAMISFLKECGSSICYPVKWNCYVDSLINFEEESNKVNAERVY